MKTIGSCGHGVQLCRSATRSADNPRPARRCGALTRKIWESSLGGMPLLFLAEELAGNDQLLNFARAFPYCAELNIAIELFRRIVFDEPVAAMDLDALVGHADGYFAGEQLGHAGLASETDVFAVGQPRSLVDQQAGGFDFGGHVRQLELNGLKLANGFAELFALLGVFGRGFERALGHPKSQCSDGNAAAIENLQAADETFAFRSQEVFSGNSTVGEDNFRSIAGTHAELVFFLPGRKPGMPFSRMKALIPCESFDLSVRAMATQMSA